jgi:hypothetical protein
MLDGTGLPGSGVRVRETVTRPNRPARPREDGVFLWRAVGDDPMEAGLAGAGVVRHQVVDLPFRDQTLGDGRAAVLSSDSPALDLEAAIGNPGFDEFASGVHSCGFCENVTAITN